MHTVCCLHACMWVCMYVCMYECIDTHIYIYTYIYIHISLAYVFSTGAVGLRLKVAASLVLTFGGFRALC